MNKPSSVFLYYSKKLVNQIVILQNVPFLKMSCQGYEYGDCYNTAKSHNNCNKGQIIFGKDVGRFLKLASLCILVVLASCSSKQGAEQLDENVVFDGQDLEDLSFGADAAIEQDTTANLDLSEGEFNLEDENLSFDEFNPSSDGGDLSFEDFGGETGSNQAATDETLDFSGDEDLSFDNFGEETGSNQTATDETLDFSGDEDLSFEDFGGETGSNQTATDETLDFSGDEDLSFEDFGGETGSNQATTDETLDFSADEDLSFDNFGEGDVAAEAPQETNSFDFNEGSSSAQEPLINDDSAFSFDDVGTQTAPEPSFDAGQQGTLDIEIEQPSQPITEEQGLSYEAPADNYSGSGGAILSIDYNAFQSNGSFVISTNSNDLVYETEFIPETNQYVVEVKGVEMSPNLMRPFLTKDFKQSFQAMNSYKSDSGVKFVFQLKGNSYPKVSKVDSKLLIEPGIEKAVNYGLKERNNTNDEMKKGALGASNLTNFLTEEKEFVGIPISIQAKNEEVVNIIQFISEEVGANIVVSDSVKGTISLKLKEVPWDQVLMSIMKIKGLGYIRSGSILRIAPLEELEKEARAVAEAEELKKTLAPFHVKVFPLSYATPSVVEEKVKSFLTVADAKRNRPAGQVLSEARSSSIIIRDTLSVIKSVAELIKELDQPPLQVMIQSKIVEASKSFSKELSSFFTTRASTENQVQGKTRADMNIVWNTETQAGADNLFSPIVTLSGIDFLGTLTQRLKLKELENKAKVISSPSVMAINNEEALIVQTDEILNEITVVGGAGSISTRSIERTPAELKLIVKPQVSSDGNIIMEINVKREFPSITQIGTAKKSREAKTKVIVGNNTTAMIGGIYQVQEDRSESGVPILRQIPLLKWLFGSSSYSKTDTELIVFVTPKIINIDRSNSGGLANDNFLSPENGEDFSAL